MMTIREYKRAETLEEAWQLNQKKANRVLGGMIWLKMENINVGTAIDLSGLGLDTIEETEGSFSIGAMVTLRQLEEHAGLAAYTHGAVKEALRHIVGVQLRNLATVGGSIYSRFGFSDVLTLFMAMDCSVELYKGGIISLQEYAERPYDRDILVRLIVKKEEAEFFYQSVRNSQTDIPVLTCAAARLENGSYRIAIGARPLKAVLFELPAKAGVSAQELAQNFADEVKQKIVTGSNMRGNAEYIPLAEAEGRIALEGALPYPPGVICCVPGEIWGGAVKAYFEALAVGVNRFPGFAPELQGVYLEANEDGQKRIWVNVLKESRRRELEAAGLIRS